MKRFALSLAIGLLSSISAASAQQQMKGPQDMEIQQPAPSSQQPAAYDDVKSCLAKVCVTHAGKTACMAEGPHFRKSQFGGGPDDFSTQVVEIRRGLRSHPVWQAAGPGIDSCIQGLKKY